MEFKPGQINRKEVSAEKKVTEPENWTPELEDEFNTLGGDNPIGKEFEALGGDNK